MNRQRTVMSHGLSTLTLALVLGSACSKSSELVAAAGDAGTAVECAQSAECVLIAKGCCGACEPTVDDVVAVRRADQKAEQEQRCREPVACGPCAVTPYEPTRPHVVAACKDARCVVQDVRAWASSACTSDTDCALYSSGCCPGCGANPSGWLALQKGKAAPVTCDPIPPCVPCTDPLEPEPYCAADGHCAVRELPRVNGKPSSSCFSPTQNLDTAYEPGAVGCDCFVQSAGVCLDDSTERKVALVCGEAAWSAVEDGPCGGG